MSDLFFVFFFLFLLLCFPLVILLIAYLAAQSRKKKQQALLKTVEAPEFYAFVRYNKGKNQDEFFKVKAFQGSGILYIKDRNIFFKDTLSKNEHSFNLDEASIQWVDINIVNGLLKWFSISDNEEIYYFNIDSGMFIFNLNSSKPTTKSVFEKLLKFQNSK